MFRTEDGKGILIPPTLSGVFAVDMFSITRKRLSELRAS